MIKKIIELIEDTNNQEKDIKDIKSYMGALKEDIFVKKSSRLQRFN